MPMNTMIRPRSMPMDTMIKQRQVNTAQYIIFLILVLGKLSARVESIRFELQSGKSKCLAEEIKKDSITVGKYHIVKETEAHPLPDSHKVTVRVDSIHGKHYHASDNITEGNFVFHTEEEGDNAICFYAADHKPPVTLTIEFEWKSGVSAKDYSHVVKKGSIVIVELGLKDMLDVVKSIGDEMHYLRERQQEVREMNMLTIFEMERFCFLSLVLCASVAGLQFWHLKSFFEKKKLI